MRVRSQVLSVLLGLLVAAGASATLTLSPAAVSLQAGTTGAPVTVTVDIPHQSSSGSGRLFFRTLPPGLTTVPSPATYAYQGSSANALMVLPTRGTGSFRIQASTAAAPGTYRVNVADGTFAAGNATLTIVVVAAAPASFQALISPLPVQLTIGGPAAPVTVTTTADPGLPFTQLTYTFQGLPGFVSTGGPRTASRTGTSFSPVTFPFTLGPGAVPGTYRGDLEGRSPSGDLKKQFRVQVVVSAPTGTVAARFAPSPLRVCDGGPPVQGSVVLEPEAGFRGSVSASWINVPAGLSVEPSRFPETALPPARTLGFTVRAQGAAPGTATLTLRVAASGGAGSRTFSLPVTVEASSYTPAVAPAALTLQAGGPAGTLSASLTAPSCFSPRTVHVRVAGVPANITVAPADAETTPPAWAPVRFTVAAGASAAAGTYPLEVIFEPLPGTAQRVRVAVTVTRVPGTLATTVSPSPLRVCNGGPPARGTLTVTPGGGYSGTPALSWRAVPPGLTVSPTAIPRAVLPPAETVTFSVSAAGAAPGPTALALSLADATAGIQRTESIPVIVADPEWTPSLSPSTVVVQASGARRTVQAAVQGNDCFTSVPVTVSVGGVPAGVTVSGQPATIQPPALAPVELAIAVAPGAPPGSYPLTVTFRPSTGVARTLTLTLTVTAGPDFQLDVQPPRAQVHAGDGLDAVVRATALNGFTGSVQVVASAPAGVAVEPPSFTLTSGAPRTVHVSTTRRRPPGGVEVSFTGTARGVAAPRSAALALVVLPPRPTEEVVGPRVDLVSPGELRPGAEAELQLVGRNFTPDTRVSFGIGVTAVGPLYAVSPTQARLRITVDPVAPIGTHLAEASNATGRNRGPGGLLVRLSPLAVVPRPKIQCAETVTLTEAKGTVNLQQPEWGNVRQGDLTTVYPVPLLDDDTAFEWREANPGTADSYEIRFFKRGKTDPSVVQRIAPVSLMGMSGPVAFAPTYFRPDGAFVARLLEATREPLPTVARPGQATAQPLAVPNLAGGVGPAAPNGYATTSASLPGALFTGGGGQLQLPAGVYGTSTPGGQGAAASLSQAGPGNLVAGSARAFDEDSILDALGMGDADMFWQVIGFKSCTAACTVPAPGQTLPPPGADGRIQVEVERSGRWPLRLPSRPLGTTCSSAAKDAPFLVETGAHHKVLLPDGTEGPNDDPNHYAGDPFEMVGNGSFTLASSPYASHPQVFMQSNLPEGVYAVVESFSFDNLFVDWGDGTVEPVTVVLPAHGAVEWNRSVELRLPDRNDCIPGEKLEEAVGGKVHFDDFCPPMPKHVFTRPGTFTVRLFVMSGDDAQKVNLASLGVAIDGADASPYLAVATSQAGPGPSAAPRGGTAGAATAGGSLTTQSPAARLAGTTTATASVQFSEAFRQAQDVAARLHPVYCTTVTISERVDPAAAGPLKLESVAVTGYPPYKAVSPLPSGAAVIAPPPPYFLVSSCDEAVVAQAELTFVGSGWVRITWVVDGERFTMPDQSVASEPRSQAELTGDPSTWPPPRTGTVQLTSPVLPVAPIGDHVVTVEALVVPKTTQTEFERAARIIARHDAGGSGDADDLAYAQAVLSLSPQPVGLLGATTQAPQGLPTVSYLGSLGQDHAALVHLTLAKPFFVTSSASRYKVASADPEQPCSFDFPTSQGPFRVTGLQGNVQADPGTGRFSGRGKVLLKYWASADVQQNLALVIVPIDGWKVAELVTVEEGEIAVHAGPGDLPVAAHGVDGHIETLQGQAGPANPLEMTAALQPVRNTLRRSDGGGPPTWEVRAPLGPDGDWYVDEGVDGTPLTLPESTLGIVPFVISSDHIAVDWSPTRGEGASAKCSGGPGQAWMGVHFGALHVLPYTFDLIDPGQLKTTFADWGLDDSGDVCGAIDIPHGIDTAYKEGRIRWDSITGSASGGAFHVYYNGFTVHDPWLDEDLVPPGNRVELSENGLAIAFGTATVTRTFGEDPDRITMTARDIRFTGVDGIPGWSLLSTADFELKGDGRDLAAFSVNDLVFDFYGRAAFPEKQNSKTVSLSGQTAHLGDTPVDLDSVKVTASEQRRLDLAVFATARLSDKLPSSPVQINYDIAWSGSAYEGSGPHTSAFDLSVEFPEGNPSVALGIRPSFFRSHSTHYSGEVDLSMFGGPPVKAEFLLGYDDSGQDYWLTRATLDFGSSGPVLVPGILQLMSIGGGMGYNFSADALKSPGPIAGVQPDMKGGHLFSAEMMAGSAGAPPGFVYTFRGVLSVRTSPFESRLDYNAWFLTNDHGGGAPLNGYFKYAGGTFDGALWGGFDVMNGSIAFGLGTEAQPAVRLHFGGGEWYIKAGDRNGARITCHFFITDADGYLEIGSQGLYVGAGVGIYMGGSAGPLSAHISGRIEGGVSLTAGPQAAGYAEGSVSAEACCCKLCIGPTITAGVNIAAWNPVSFGCHACFEFDLLLKTVKKCANFHI